MPLGVLRSYISVLPRLRAEGSLERVGETLIGTGNMEKRHAERALAGWERAAQSAHDARPQMTEEERREYYAETGFFDVEVVEVAP